MAQRLGEVRSTLETQNATLGRGGNTLTNQAKLTVSTFGLREVSVDPQTDTKKYGNLIQGQAAIDIVSSYNEANSDKKLKNLEVQCRDIVSRKGITPQTRVIKADQTIESRASDLIRGQVLGFMNSCPSRFSVAGKTYLYEKIVTTRYAKAENAIKAITNEGYIGSPQGDKIELCSDTEITNILCVSKETLTKAVEKFMEIVEPKIVGDTLYYKDMPVYIFAKEGEVQQITKGLTNYDPSEIKVF